MYSPATLTYQWLRKRLKYHTINNVGVDVKKIWVLQDIAAGQGRVSLWKQARPVLRAPQVEHLYLPKGGTCHNAVDCRRHIPRLHLSSERADSSQVDPYNGPFSLFSSRDKSVDVCVGGSIFFVSRTCPSTCSGRGPHGLNMPAYQPDARREPKLTKRNPLSCTEGACRQVERLSERIGSSAASACGGSPALACGPPS